MAYGRTGRRAEGGAIPRIFRPLTPVARVGKTDRVTGRNQNRHTGLSGGRQMRLARSQGRERKSEMLKKAMAAAAVAASVVGMSAAAAPQALAIGDDSGTTSASGNGAHEAFGNSVTKGDLSPQATLVQGSVNKLCAGVPVKANVASLLLLVPIGVQDVPVLSAPQNQQCAENSTQAKGDEPLSHILDDISALSGNGAGNG